MVRPKCLHSDITLTPSLTISNSKYTHMRMCTCACAHIHRMPAERKQLERINGA